MLLNWGSVERFLSSVAGGTLESPEVLFEHSSTHIKSSSLAWRVGLIAQMWFPETALSRVCLWGVKAGLTDEQTPTFSPPKDEGSKASLRQACAQTSEFRAFLGHKAAFLQTRRPRQNTGAGPILSFWVLSVLPGSFSSFQLILSGPAFLS